MNIKFEETKGRDVHKVWRDCKGRDEHKIWREWEPADELFSGGLP